MDQDVQLQKKMHQQTRVGPKATDTFTTVYTRDLPEVKPAMRSTGVATDDIAFNGWTTVNNRTGQVAKEVEKFTMKPDKLEHQRLFAEQMARKMEKKEVKPYRKTETEILKENIQVFENNKNAAMAHKQLVQKSKILTDAERFDKLISN